jgi:hypothetical protein
MLLALDRLVVEEEASGTAIGVNENAVLSSSVSSSIKAMITLELSMDREGLNPEVFLFLPTMIIRNNHY